MIYVSNGWILEQLGRVLGVRFKLWFIIAVVNIEVLLALEKKLYVGIWRGNTNG